MMIPLTEAAIDPGSEFAGDFCFTFFFWLRILLRAHQCSHTYTHTRTHKHTHNIHTNTHTFAAKGDCGLATAVDSQALGPVSFPVAGAHG